jgi:hypothetical protein
MVNARRKRSSASSGSPEEALEAQPSRPTTRIDGAPVARRAVIVPPHLDVRGTTAALHGRP